MINKKLDTDQTSRIRLKKNITLNWRKKVLFNIILIAIPVIIIVSFEFILRIADYGFDLKLFRKSATFNGYLELNKKIARRFFINFKASSTSNDIFLENKPDSCYRIFVMGESTTRGFPYKTGITFSRILNYRLQDVFPHKKIEIINTGLTAVNSYTLLDFIDEILAQKPDLILIYTGHNEYYGSFGIGSVENGGNTRWIKILHLKLVRLRSFQFMQNFVKYVTKKISSGNISDSGKTLMERVVKDKSIVYGSNNYYAGIEQFRVNMGKLIAKVKKSGVDIIISEQVCNVRDLKPFNSVATDKFPRADNIYSIAKQFEIKGDYNNARKKYYEAKDLDIIRFRAPEDINMAINELGEKYNIPVVSMKYYFEKQSPHGLIGDNLMTEHVHPNIGGYFLLADAFFNTIRNLKYIDSNWDSTLIKPSLYYRNNWGFTPLDSLVADISIKLMKYSWPFQTNSSIGLFKSTYKPKSIEDSVAFRIVCDQNIEIEKVHQNFAIYYSKQNKFLKAYNEYYSLIKWYPYINELYLRAFYYLSAANENKKACDLLKSTPGIDTLYSHLFQLGLAYYKQHQYNEATYYLEKAKRISKTANKDEFLLQILYYAQKLNGNDTKAAKLLSDILAINPKFVPSGKLEKQQIIVIPKSIKQYINNAMKAGKEGKIDLALQILFKANEIEESPYVNMCIANILLQKKDKRALNYLEKYNRYSPQNPELLYKLTVLYISTGDYKKASETLYQFREISTDYLKIIRLHEDIEIGLKMSGGRS